MKEFIKIWKKCKIKATNRIERMEREWSENWNWWWFGAYRSIFRFHSVRRFRLALCLASLPLNTLPHRSKWVNERKLIIIVFRCSATASHANTQKNTQIGRRVYGEHTIFSFLGCFFIYAGDELMQSQNRGILSAKKGETIKLDALFKRNQLIAKQTLPSYGIFFAFISTIRLLYHRFFFVIP